MYHLKHTWKRALGIAIGLAALFCACLNSTFLTRDPVAVYLTWQRQPDTTMTIQWIESLDAEETRVEYCEEGTNTWSSMQGTRHLLPTDQIKLYAHVAELTNLSPDTIYRFRFPHKEREYRFRTMPSQLDDSIRFIVGGDMYHEGIDILQAANREAANLNPRFVVAGGDLAYAEPRNLDDQTKWMRWLEFVVRWSEDMVTTDGLMIPILAVIGNHDVRGRYDQPLSSAEFYYALFSAMPGSQGYNVLDFGDYASVIMLDTGHTHPIEGDQTNWLNWVLKERQNITHRFAMYHVPAFPSVRRLDGKHNEPIRKYWVPLFEQWGLHAAFEHHDHAFKRTHPIKEGKVDPSGVLYLGDGAWGATPRTPVDAKERWYLAKTAAAQHFIVIDITPQSRRFRAVDVPTGNIIDEHIQTLDAVSQIR